MKACLKLLLNNAELPISPKRIVTNNAVYIRWCGVRGGAGGEGAGARAGNEKASPAPAPGDAPAKLGASPATVGSVGGAGAGDRFGDTAAILWEERRIATIYL